MLIFQCCEFDNRVRVCAVSLCGVLTGQIWLLVSISLCGFNLTLQLVWMLRGNPFLLETFPLDLPQHIVCAPSALSNYSLGGAGWFFWWGVMYRHLFSFLTEFRNESDAPIFILFCREDYTLTYRSLLSAGMNRSWTRQHRWGGAGKWKASKASCHLLYIIRPFPCSCSPKHPEYSRPYSSEEADSPVNPAWLSFTGEHISNISPARRQALSSSVLKLLCPGFVVHLSPSALAARCEALNKRAQ